MKKEQEQCCRTCKFYIHIPNVDDLDECRRFPDAKPKKETYWCGEYKEKK